MRHACIRGITSQERIVFWMHKNKLTQLRAVNKPGYYSKLAKDQSRWTYKNEVKIDIQRTFPLDSQFIAHMTKFERLVNVFCLQMPKEVGYFQGMNFVCGTIFRVFNYQEESAFWCLIQLFNRQSLLQVFDISSKKYKILNFQTEVLLWETHSKLAAHLKKFDFDISVYTVKWFFSVFCIDLPE